MLHLPHLISDLALILVSAGIITLLFKWLKQPLVLGYIVAGLLAGPYIHIFPTVGDRENISLWAEIGVVFLLFGLGLEFSFKKLMNVGATAFITAGTEVITMLIVGYWAGHLLEWSDMDAIFLGGMLSMSSTTIIIKAFDDLGLRNKRFTSIVFGTLVVEDLVAILMMVLLSTLAVSKGFVGKEMIESVFKVVFFLILWFLVGVFLIPAFLKRVKKLINDETLLIIALGLCLGMVVIATKTGFSAALGAFIMGSILAETIEAEHIEHIITPVKDLFGAIFFVSVGMLINPAILVKYAWPVLLITFITLIGKAIFSSCGVLLSGQSLKVSIRSGFSLAQIGEFAFIIAGLGVSLGVLDAFVSPVIVAVSVITTFTTPYFIRLSEPFAEWVYRVLPEKVRKRLDRYASGSKTINHDSDWRKLIKKYSVHLLVQSVLLTAIFLLSTQILYPFLERFPQIEKGRNSIVSIITLILMLPFLTALISNKNNSPVLFMNLWKDNKYNRGRLVALVLFRVFMAIFFVSLVLIHYYHVKYGIGIILAVAVLALALVFRRDLNQYIKLESLFLSNLNRREEVDREKHPLKAGFSNELADKDIHLTSVVVSPYAACAGKSLAELSFRKRYGVSVVEIIRGDRKIYIPDGSECIYPQDKLSIVGTDRQLKVFQENMQTCLNGRQEVDIPHKISVFSFIVDENFPYVGKSIGQSEFGKKYNGLIVAIERDNSPLIIPDKHTVLFLNDLVWVVGDKKPISKLIGGE